MADTSKKIEAETKLYHYISFPEFVNICLNKELRFVHPTSWDDTYEGSLLRLLGDNYSDSNVVERLYYGYFCKDVEKTLNGYMRLWGAKYGVYGRCWTTLEESDAMWRIYSYNEQSVQIETTVASIQNVLDANELEYAYASCIKSVEYDLSQDDVLEDGIRSLTDNRELFTPFLHKRPAYKHEEESRALLFLNPLGTRTGMLVLSASNMIKNKNLTDDDNINAICKEISVWRPNLSNEQIPNGINLKIGNLEEYVSGVKVSPFAREWFCGLGGNLCDQYGLMFKGKSTLYDKI